MSGQLNDVFEGAAKDLILPLRRKRDVNGPIYWLAVIHTVDNIQCAPVIPEHKDIACVVDALNRAQGTGGWSKRVAHVMEPNTGPGWIALPHVVKGGFVRK